MIQIWMETSYGSELEYNSVRHLSKSVYYYSYLINCMDLSNENSSKSDIFFWPQIVTATVFANIFANI